MANRKIKPFDSFNLLFKVLVLAGYYKLMNEPKYKLQAYLHKAYRVFVFMMITIYSFQHCFYIVQVIEDKDQLYTNMMIGIPQLNLIAKILAVSFGYKRLENIREVLNGPIFEASSKTDEEFLKQHNKEFNRLVKITLVSITLTAVVWTISPILERMEDKDFNIASYFPFEVNSDARFALTVALEHGPVFWTGCGHIALDLLIAGYYYEATMQLKIIRHNLALIFDSDAETRDALARTKKWYIDEADTKYHDRFVKYVERYDKVVWFVNEVTSVFHNAIAIQFFTTSSIICLVVYEMSVISPSSALFVFLIGYFVALQFQVFLYCYNGELILNESRQMSDSLYLSEWQDLSPRFRRMLLIAMSRWLTPIAPRVFTIIPLALPTFITIIRAAFNLFTVLRATNSAKME